MISSATARQQLPGLTRKSGQFKFAQDDLAPIFHTSEYGGHYDGFEVSNFLNIPRQVAVAPGIPKARILSKLFEKAIPTQHFAVEEPVPSAQVAKYSGTNGAVQGSQAVAENVLLVCHELRVAALSTGVDVSSASPATKWDQANSDPCDDVSGARQVILSASGLVANVMVCGYWTYEALKKHPKILELAGGSFGQRWFEILAAIFDVERFSVGTAVVADDKDNATPVHVWSDSVVLAHCDFTENLSAPSFMRSFLTTKDPNAPSVTSDLYDDTGSDAKVVRAQQHIAAVLTGAELGYHLSNVLAGS